MNDPYTHNHTHLINHTHGSYPGFQQLIDTTRYYYAQEPPPMTTLQKVQSERHERRERERIDGLYNEYDALDLPSLPDGTVIRFTRPDDRTHAAVYVNECWYVTGGSAPNEVTTEDLLAWLISKDVSAGDLVVLEA